MIVIRGVHLSPILKIGEIWPTFHSDGRVPSANESPNRILSCVFSTQLDAWRTRGWSHLGQGFPQPIVSSVFFPHSGTKPLDWWIHGETVVWSGEEYFVCPPRWKLRCRPCLGRKSLVVRSPSFVPRSATHYCFTCFCCLFVFVCLFF